MSMLVLLLFGLIVFIFTCKGNALLNDNTGDFVCLNGTIQLDGACYKFFQEKKTWNESRDYCNGIFGGHLAIVNSSDVFNYIKSILIQRNISYAWLGATDNDADGVFQWIDGGYCCPNWWVPGEPSSHRHNPRCFGMWRTGNGSTGFDNAACSVHSGFVCQMKGCHTIQNCRNQSCLNVSSTTCSECNHGYALVKNASYSSECQLQALTSTTPSKDIATSNSLASAYLSSQTGNGTWCFRCDGMTHLQYCDRVEKCQNNNEVCFVQRYTRSLEIPFYNSGCIDAKYCDISDSQAGCLHCCKDNFCNSVGCGDNGFKELGNRGPICFDCNHLGENETCKTVQLCHANESCIIEKFEWGDNSHYLMGCADSQVCPHHSVRGVSTRKAPICAHCCQSDFCNMNCSAVSTGPIFVG